MKLQLLIPVVILLVFSACMDVTITQETAEAPQPDDPLVTAVEPAEDIGPVHTVVPDMPTLVGGMDELFKGIEYPEIAVKAGVQGRVHVQFVVDKEGNVRDAEVVRGIGAGCDEEALRVIQLAKFNPGRIDGEAVNTQMSLPVMFKLR